MFTRRIPIADRLAAKTDYNGPLPEHLPELGPCHIWTGGKYANGYGSINDPDRGNTSTHRVAWELEKGPIPKGQMPDHRCHRRACVNVGHMRLVTTKQNQENASGVRSDSRSGLRGVTEENPGRWRAYATHNGKRVRGKVHSSAEAAAREAAEIRNRLFTHNDLDRIT